MSRHVVGIVFMGYGNNMVGRVSRFWSAMDSDDVHTKKRSGSKIPTKKI
jgi:hypothetical protein